MARRVSSATSLDTLRKEAKRWLRALRANDEAAKARFDRMYPGAPPPPTLRDVQHALAREHGYESWVALKKALPGAVSDDSSADEGTLTAAQYESIAADFVLAFNARDEDALRRLNERRGTSFTFDDLGALVWRAVYAFRQRSFRDEGQYLLLDEARAMVARAAGYASWDALTGAPGARPARVPPYVIDEKENSISPRRLMSAREWDELIEVMKERRISLQSPRTGRIPSHRRSPSRTLSAQRRAGRTAQRVLEPRTDLGWLDADADQSACAQSALWHGGGGERMSHSGDSVNLRGGAAAAQGC